MKASQTPESGLTKDAQRHKGSLLKALTVLYRFQGSPHEDSWGFSSAGRAPALQAGGQRFDPANLHHIWVASLVG